MLNHIDNQIERIDPDSNLNINLDRCSYFTIDEFNSKFNNDAGTYLLLNQNLQSFNAKQHLLEAFLESISLPFHTLVLTETWNKKNISICVSLTTIRVYIRTGMYRNILYVGAQEEVFQFSPTPLSTA